MKYIEFRDAIASELRRHADGFTWAELRSRMELPYDRPCPTWVRRLEDEIGLSRIKGKGRAYIWKIFDNRTGD